MAWSEESKAKLRKTLAAKKAAKGAKRRAVDDAHTTGSVMTYLRHGAADVLAGIQRGELTLRNLPRRDVLTLLAYVETRG